MPLDPFHSEFWAVSYLIILLSPVQSVDREAVGWDRWEGCHAQYMHSFLSLSLFFINGMRSVVTRRQCHRHEICIGCAYVTVEMPLLTSFAGFVPFWRAAFFQDGPAFLSIKLLNVTS